MAGNRTTFAIVVENTGHSSAYDITVGDVIPTGYQAPAGGINLCVRNGAGTSIPFSGSAATFVTATGVTLDDGATGALAAGKNASDVVNGSGTNIAVITFDLEVATSVNPLNVVTNTASMTAYSSSDGGPNFIPGGLADTATSTIAPPTITKTLTSTSLANTAGTSVNIGEVATFTTVLTVPAGTTPATVTDILPANFAFVGCTSVTSSSPQLTSSIGAFSNACNPGTNPTVGAGGTPVVFNLGTLTNASGIARTVTIVYSAVPTNIAANVNGVSRTSVATLGYANASGPQTLASATAGVSIVEPKLTVATIATPTVGEAGTTIAFTTTVGKGTSTSDAFEALLKINVPAGMTYVPGSVLCTGAQVTTGCSFTGNTGTVTWATFTNTANTTVITYSATLDATVTPKTVYTVTAPLSWTSMPGSPAQASTFNALSFERTGVTTDPGLAANNYAAPSSRTITTNSPVPTKLVATSSEATSTGNNLLIGEVVRYRLVATIPAGVSSTVSITDVLPPNLQFLDDSTARIAFVSNGAGMATSNAALTSCAGGLNVSGTATTIAAIPVASVTCVVPAANISGAPFVAGTDPVFTLGTITNNDRDADVESVVIDLNALVLNVDANGTGTVIPNQTRLIDNAITYNSTVFNQTVIQPTVTVAKTILTQPGQAGGNIVYQIVVTNTSSFSTYDIRLLDVVPASLIVDSRALAGAAPTANASAGNTVDLTWDTLTTGQTATITVNGHVDPLAASGLTISNTATMTWTSLPGTGGTTGNPTGSNTPGGSGSTTGERTGVGGTPNLLTSSSTIATTLAAPTIVKSGGPATVAVGDTLTYNLVTTLAEGTTKALVISDLLPSGLTYTGSSVITSAAASSGLLTADYAGAGTLAVPVLNAPATGGPVTFTFGDTVNPADGIATNNKVLVRVTARVRNIAPANIRGSVIANTATVTYTNPNTGLAATTAPTAAVNSTIIEPRLSLAETVSVAASRNDAGGIVTYQIVVAPVAPGNATADDASLAGTIPAGMTYVPASLNCSTGTLTPNTCTMVGSNLSATWASIAQSGVSTTITYQASFDNTVTPSQVLTHASSLTWKSLPTDALNPDIRTGADGAAGSPNSYAATASVSSSVVPQTIAKVLTTTSEASTSGASLAIGETATYTLTVTLPEGTTPGVTVVDDLPLGLAYVAGSATVSVAGFDGSLPVPAVTAPGGSGGDVTLVFGSTSVTADNVTTNNSFTVTFQAQVLDIAGNQSLTTLANNSRATIGAVVANSPVVNATVVEPVLTSTLVPSTAAPTFSTPVTYTYSLSHTGASNSDAKDLVVTVTIPATIVYTPGSAVAPAGWTVDDSGIPSTLRFTAATLTTATGSAAFSWIAVTPAVGVTSIGVTSLTSVVTTYTSLAGAITGERTGAGGVDDYRTTVSSTVTLTGVDLTITNMSDGGITATPGSLVPYVISFRNDGNATATGVTLTATVPANSTFDAAGSSAGWSCANGAPAGSVCTLAIAPLGAAGTGTRTFAVRPVSPWGVGVPKILNVTSSITNDGTHGPDPTANNTGADSTPISASPDLTTTITDGKTSVNANETSSYQVAVTNVGHQDAAGVVISMTVPAHTYFIAGSSTAGWACSDSTPGSPCTFAVGNLAGDGGTTSVTFAVSTEYPMSMNVASIVATDSVADDGTGGADPTPANNTAIDTDTVPIIDLSVALAGGLAHQGIPYVITATITNAGPAAATLVTDVIQIPAGLSYVSDDGAGAFDGMFWTVGNVAVGQTKTLHIIVMPTVVGSRDVYTEVLVASQSDVDSRPSNTSSTEDDDDLLAVAIDPTADLAVTKAVDLPTVEVGDTVAFTVSVHNAGPNTAANVTVNDLLPAGLSYVGDDASGAYNAGTGIWTVGSLANGASATIVITATVTVPGTTTNAATVGSDTFDPTPADNVASAAVYARSQDIAVSKVIVGATPNYLGTVTYEITVRNLGPDSSAVTVTDLLPAGLAYLGDDAAGAYDPITGAWAAGTLAAGDSAILTITAQAVATGVIANTATVTDRDHFDPNAANDSSTASMTVAPGVDVSVTIAADDTTPAFHQAVTLTVTAHNAGPDTAADTDVTVALPAGLAYVSDDASGAYAPGTGVWTIGDLLPGETRVVFITATVVATGTIDAPASISTSTFDHDLTNNADLETLLVPNSADLSITKTVDEAAPHNAENVVFTITVHNAGPDDATPQVDDLLPAGLSYVSDDGGGAYDPGTGVWTIGSLADGADATLHVTAKAMVAGPVTNTATVSSPDYDENPADNTDAAMLIVVPAADVSTTIAPSDATPNVGDQVVLTITAANAGPDNAQDTVLTATIPAGLAYVSDDIGGAYDPGTGTWTLGTLNSGTTVTLHVVVTVTAPGTIVMPVSIGSSTYDPNLANNIDSATLDVPQAAVSIVKTVDDATPDYLDQVTFTITAANAGPDTAENVTVSDLLPAGLAYVGDDASGDYVPATGAWTIGSLASGASVELHVTARVTATGTTVNTASITADTFDPTPADNVDSAAIDVDPASDISAQIIVSDATPDVGQPISYTVTIHNAGPDDATGVSAAIVLPGALTYVSDDAAGAYDPLTGTLTIGSLAAGSSVVVVIDVTPNAPGSIDLAVAATSTTFDADLTNNADSVTILVPTADLVVTKSVSDASPDYLAGTTFTVRVRNDGPSDATGVVLSDVLPAGLTYVADDSGGSYNPATGDWTIGALANGDSVTLHITVSATATGSLVNTATVSAVTHDPSPANNTDGATVTVAPAGDVSITKTVDDETPNVGDVVTFTVTVHNAGPDTAAGVSVADVMPFGLEYVSDDGSGAYDPLTGTWTIGSLAAGADAVVHMSATVTESGEHVNTATVSATTYDQDLSNNVATTAPAADLAADLAVTDSVSDPAPSLNDVVTYAVVAGNNGPDTGTGVQVSFPLPTGFAYVGDDGAGAYDPGTGIWTIGSLAEGDTVTLVVQARVIANGTLTTTAIVGGTLYDPAPPNNISSATLVVLPADLSVTKTVSDPAPDYLGDVVYTIVVTNSGPSDATGVTIDDLLPAGLTHVSDDGAGAYDAGVWTIGSLADGASVTLEITARVTATGTIANLAAVGSLDQLDPDSGNDSDQATINVDAAADLEVVVTGSNDAPSVGQPVDVSVTVTNNGPDAASNVTLANVFPSVLTLVSDDSGGAYDPGTGVWTIGSIPAGGSVTLMLTTTAATVGSSSDDGTATTSTYEADLSNNADTWLLEVHPTSDLTLTKTADEPIPHNGTNITYMVTAHNDGPNGATGVRVADLLPVGLAYVSDDASGDYDAGTGVWTVGTIADGADATIHIVATVVTSGLIINTGEVVASDNFDPDSTPGNGEALEDDQATAAVNGQAAADLSVTTAVAVLHGVPHAPLIGDVNLGGTVEFTITTTNDGPDDATGVATRFVLPAGLLFVSDDAAGTYDPASGLWTIGGLAAGGTVTFHVTAEVTATGTMAADAELVSAFEWDPDSTPSNGIPSEDDQAAAPVGVPAAAGLTLSKSVSAPQVARGQVVTFTIAVHNDGPDAATNVVVTDVLPAGMSFVSAAGDEAFDSGTMTWTIPSIGDGETATLLLTVRLDRLGTIQNVAQLLGGDQFDPNKGDVLATAAASVRVVAGPDDTLPFTDVDPGNSLVATLIALLAGLSFLAVGETRRRSRRPLIIPGR